MLLRNISPGFTISIGPDIKIKVISTGERYVRLGFEAPRSIKILIEQSPPICDNAPSQILAKTAISQEARPNESPPCLDSSPGGAQANP